MTIRADVVSLLTDINLDNLEPGQRAHHNDGRPCTDTEMETLHTATLGEVKASSDYLDTVVGFHTEQHTDMQRVITLCKPYYDQLPDDATLGDVRPLMTDGERTELAELLDRLAPDGNLLVRS